MVVTDELEIAVEEHGDAGRDAVLLLHGWPDDIRCWDGLLEPLVDAEFHVIVPYLRGFGATRFRRPEAMRSGQLTALAGDVLALADGLGLIALPLSGTTGAPGRRTSRRRWLRIASLPVWRCRSVGGRTAPTRSWRSNRRRITGTTG